MFPFGTPNSAMDESAPYYNTFNTPHSPEAYPPVQQQVAYAGTSELHNTFNTPHSPEAYPPVQQRDAYAGTAELHNTSNLQPYGVSPYGPPPDPPVGQYSVPPLQDHSSVLASTFYQTAPGPASNEAQVQYAPQENAHPSGPGPEHPSPAPNSIKHTDPPSVTTLVPPPKKWDPRYQLVHVALEEEAAAKNAACVAYRVHVSLQHRLRTKYSVHDQTIDMQAWLDHKLDLPRRRRQVHTKLQKLLDWRKLVRAREVEKAAIAKVKEKHEVVAQLHDYAMKDSKGFQGLIIA